MVRYRSTPEGWRNLETGEIQPYPDPTERRVLELPMVVRDIEPYASPMTGKMITSRSEARYDLEKHGMRLQEPDESPTKGKIRNAKFAAKRGLKVSDEFKDYDSSEKQKEMQ